MPSWWCPSAAGRDLRVLPVKQPMPKGSRISRSAPRALGAGGECGNRPVSPLPDKDFYPYHGVLRLPNDTPPLMVADPPAQVQLTTPKGVGWCSTPGIRMIRTGIPSPDVVLAG